MLVAAWSGTGVWVVMVAEVVLASDWYLDGAGGWVVLVTGWCWYLGCAGGWVVIRWCC